MEYDVIIVGGGPAGTSAAIRLAQAGARVLVLEAKHMPRHKLCGEFIAPECYPTLERLGVKSQVLSEGSQITNLSLTASSGRQVSAAVGAISIEGEFATGLSRARFDQILFDRAREVGATCLEGFAVKRCLFEERVPCGVEALELLGGRTHRFHADVVIDASGRNSRLSVGVEERKGGRHGSRLYAFKSHLTRVDAIRDQVELYFFRHGYGGLSRVEGGLVNLCFIANERTVKQAGGDFAGILNRTVMQNPLSRERLASAEMAGKWHSTGPLTFGSRRLSRDGVIAVGDAAGMIDPFTGTGVQMALRTGEMAADGVIAAFAGEREYAGTEALAAHPEPLLPANSNRAVMLSRALTTYRGFYDQEFRRRMTASGLLRSAAFSPLVANALSIILAHMPRLAGRILRATRSGNRPQR
jgi:geranylgeranyl reductase family protein